MAPKKDYKGLIWTNHVIERLNQRKIPQDWAWKTYRFPDNSTTGKEPKTLELTKQIEDRTVTLIIKKNDKDEWLLLSCWIDPPFVGSIDTKTSFYRKSPKTPLMFRIFSYLKKSLFRSFFF